MSSPSEEKQLCNVLLGEFVTFFPTLTIVDKCPVCGIVGGRHPRNDASNTHTNTGTTHLDDKNCLSASTRAFMKLKSQIPQWSTKIECRTFLKGLDLVLRRNPGIPKEDWPQILLNVGMEQSAEEWIMTHIIDTKLDWDEAKKKFTSHYQRAGYSVALMKKYDGCKQQKEESVQVYADRFLDICREMDRADDDWVTMQHFINGLHFGIRQKYDHWLANQQVEKDDVEYRIESLQKLVRVCIIHDVASRTSGIISSGGQSVSSMKVESKSNIYDNKPKKYCSIHKSTGHDTSECRSNQQGGKPSSITSGSTSNKGSTNIICFKCNEPGHKAPDCQLNKRSIGSTSSSTTGVSSTSSSAVTTSNRFDALGKREVKPPEILTYNKPGVQATSNVVAKAATLDDGKQQMKPSRVHLYFADNNQTYAALVDTGAGTSFIDSKLAKQLGLKVNKVNGSITYASEEMKSTREGITEVLSFAAIKCIENGSKVQCVPIQSRFELVPLDVDKYQFIIGTDLLSVLFPDNIPSSFYQHMNNDVPSLCRMGINFMDSLIDTSSVVNSSQLLDEMVGIGSIPAEEVKERASVSTPLSLAEEYDAKRESIFNEPPIKQQIEINDAISGFCNLPESIVHLPVDPSFKDKGYRKQYNIPQAARQAVTDQVDKWFKSGKIVEAPLNCPYNSSLTVANKKDAYGNFTGIRVCLDTRALNSAILEGDRFQLPYIRDVLEKFQGCEYFGEIDLSEAYLQFQLDEESQPYTAFTWENRQYMFVGCPFGISLLPSYFQRVMCKVVWDLIFTCPYLDNLPFGSKSVSEHANHLFLILERCNQYNLKIKLSAMKVCHSEIRCLGHLLTKSGIALSPSKLEWVANCERPVTGKQLQTFLGMITFLRPNVRHMSELTASLEGVKNVTTELVWTERMIADWEATKQAIATAPTLAYPDFNKPFHIATDASNVGIGGVLYQPIEYGGDITADNIVSMVSKKLANSELNYSAYKKELFAIVHCLRKFHQYIWGQPNVIIFTDHKPLTYMFQSRDLSPALQQWLDVLLDYQFELHYREGKLNILPDQLSRLYASEYDGSVAWGVPKVMPWKIQPSIADPDSMKSVQVATVSVNNVTIEEVVDDPVEQNVENFFSNSSVAGGGNAEALENKQVQAENVAEAPVELNEREAPVQSDDREKIIAAIIEIERTGCVIPETDQRDELIERQHAFGHFGINAVCSGLIRNNYWWKGMRKDVQRVLSNCDPCNRFTVVRSGFNPAMYIMSSKPWEHLQFDCSVHLPPAPGGYKVLLVIIDVFTGFVILRPMKTTSADIVANELWNVCCTFGLPKIVQSDNGPEFVNEVIRALVKLVGIEHRFISPYNPRADGKVERSIQTVMSIIKKLLHGHENNWTLFVPFAQLSFNNKVASLTGSTPFSLMFGRSLNPIRDYTADGSEINIGDLDTWKLHMEKVQSLIYPAIVERTKVSKDQMIQALNKKRRLLTKDSIIPIGAIVMLNDPLRQNKFEPKYIGPYTVTHRTRNGNYQLKDDTGVELDRRVPPDQLKLVSKSKRQRDHEINYVVDYIMDHRGEPGTYEYYTKFKGYDMPEWNAEQNFHDTKCISDYWKNERT